MAVTIRDVAAAAGVSTATVSRALSGRRPVAPQLAKSVLEASERLGYRPNVVARSLRTQSTGTVGMVIPRISNPFFPAIVEAVERELASDDRQLLLCDSQGSVATEGKRITALLARQVDGLLVIACEGTASSPTVQRAAASVPVVQIDRLVDGSSGDYVGTDNEVGMRLLIEHLRDKGASTFAFVSAEPTVSSARVRFDAFRRATADVSPAASRGELLGDFTYEWGRECADRLLADGLPDAVMCGADLIALGLLSSLTAAGVRVPSDVLVTGYDDIGFASLSNPQLTTVRQPMEEIGVESVRLLRARLESRVASPQHRVLLPTLVVRGSTASAATPST